MPEVVSSRSSVLWDLLLLGAVAMGGCTIAPNAEKAQHAFAHIDDIIGDSIDLSLRGLSQSSTGAFETQLESNTSRALIVFGNAEPLTSGALGVGASLRTDSYYEFEAIPGDGWWIVYRTEGWGSSTDPTLLPHLELEIDTLPSGVFEGWLEGGFDMLGTQCPECPDSIDGPLSVSLALTGAVEPDPDLASCPLYPCIRRVIGRTRASGIATSDYGTIHVDITF